MVGVWVRVWLPDNFTQSVIFLDKVIWEIYKKPNQQILSIQEAI